MGLRLYATFVIDDMLFGVDATDVQEILRPQRLTPVPMANDDMGGLMNLRGQIVATLDLRRRLGLGAHPDGQPLNIVLRTEHGPVSIMVDRVGDVFEADDTDLAAAPETLSPSTGEIVRAVHKLEDQLLLVLDVTSATAPVVA